MERLQREALDLLEFPKVLLHLAAYTSFEPAREQALALEPTFNRDEVLLRQGETQEAIALLEAAGEVDTSGAGDIRPHVHRADLGGFLSGQELRQILHTLQVARRARAAVLQHRRQAGGLGTLAAEMPSFRELEQEIERTVDPAGEVLDSASPELERARRESRSAYQRLEQALNRFIRSRTGQEALQEPLITQRSYRLVVPVKSEMRQRVPGLVHDVSHSGATLFVEPTHVVSLNNAWREWALEEERQVERALQRLSTLVGDGSERIGDLVSRLAHLDLALAKARYARALGAREVDSWEGDRPYVRLVRARHPLLKGESVPVSMELGLEHTVLLITGPNAGGKTVSLKMAGLLGLMYQAGLQVPCAEGTVLPVFDAVYADIGDRQSLEESLSTFSSHVRSLLAILLSATSGSLVLLDELGTSTDPEEGAALAKAVLAHFGRRGIATVATSHYRNLAGYVEEMPGMVNASVELDAETLQPTYHLTPGLPGRSYALIIAERLGIPNDIIREAQELRDPGHRQAEELLASLQEERSRASRLRDEAELARAEADRMKEEYAAAVAGLQQERAQILADLRRELGSRAEDLRKRLRQAERSLEEAQTQERVKEALSTVLGARRELRTEEWRLPEEEQPPWWRALEAGDRVKVKGFDLKATVVSPPGKGGRVEVRLGSVRAQFDVERLEPAEPAAEEPAPGYYQRTAMARPAIPPSAQLDLRGTRVDEALDRVDAFVDQALLQGLSQVRIVHGKGTGALRQAIREHLKRHPSVASFEAEEDAIGGDGATVASLV